MGRRINFINPFGTTAYDAIITKTLGHYRAEGTELDVTHLENCPPDIDYFYSKHMIEMSLYEEVMRSEETGYDAVIVGIPRWFRPHLTQFLHSSCFDFRGVAARRRTVTLGPNSEHRVGIRGLVRHPDQTSTARPQWGGRVRDAYRKVAVTGAIP